MAGKKTVANAGEAAGKASKAAGKTPSLVGKDRNAASYADLSPEGKAAMLARGDQLRIDAVAAFELENQIIPELKAAGMSNQQIKSIYGAADPYVAGKQLLVDERGALTDGILKSGQPYDAQTLDGFSLRELKDTLTQINKGGNTQRPSGIRGKDPAAEGTTETRLPDEKQTASTPAQLEDPAKAEAAQPQAEKDSLRAFLARGSEVFSDGPPAGSEGFFRENVFGPAGNFRSVATPGGGIQKPTMVDVQAAPPRTPSLAEIVAQVRGEATPKPAKQKQGKPAPLANMPLDPGAAQVNVGPMPQPAAQAGGQIVVGSQFDQGMPAGIVDATQTRRAASPSVQPAPPLEVAPKQEVPSGPPISETDPLVRNIKYVAGSIPKAPLSWGVGTAGALGVAKALGWLPGGGQSSPQQGQQQAMPPINILSPEAIRQIEQGGSQPEARPQPKPAPGPNQSTDIIRRLAGRMA